MADVSFINLVITVSAKTPRLAYEKLCAALDTDRDIEYETAQYVTYNEDGEPQNPRSTEELFGDVR